MNMIDNAQRTAAKVAGIAGLLAFVLVVFGNYVLLEPLVIPRNAADTARNILAHQTQFRIALTCFIAYGIGSVVLLSALYVILAPVNRGLALTGALFRLVFAILWLIAPLNQFGRASPSRRCDLSESFRTGPITSAGPRASRRKFR